MVSIETVAPLQVSATAERARSTVEFLSGNTLLYFTKNMAS